jgi:hypothetical protein
MIAWFDPDELLMPITEAAGALRKSERHPGNAGSVFRPAIEGAQNQAASPHKISYVTDN